MKVIIVGGGIGGLSAALALRQAGHDPLILEEAPELGDVGAGLLLWPNATSLLRQLGVLDELMKRSGRAKVFERWTDRGRFINRVSLESVERHFGAPTIVVRRSVLHEVLRSALPVEALQLSSRCIGVEETSAILESGEKIAGDLLVGADGLHSTVRASLHGERAPHYSGTTAWRGMASGAELAEGTFFFAWGRGSQFGAVRLDDDRVYWFATKNAPEGDKLEDLRVRFRGWHPFVTDLVGRTERVVRHDLYDREPAWGRGNVTLLGDAAHPMTPHLGQGACQAIEDAVSLAQRLPDLRAYERERAPRAKRLVRMSRALGAFLQTESGIATELIYRTTRLTPAWFSLRVVESFLR